MFLYKNKDQFSENINLLRRSKKQPFLHQDIIKEWFLYKEEVKRIDF